MVKKKLGDIVTLEAGSKSTLEKLNACGYNTRESIAFSSPKKIAEIAGISEDLAEKVYDAAYKSCDMSKYQTGAEFKKRSESRRYITTGVKGYDDLLGGKGVRAQELTGISGRFSSGKTECVFQLTVNAQLPVEQGGLGKDTKVIFCDTEATFSHRRIEEMAIAKGLNPEEVLNNILYIRVFNSLHQIRALNETAKLFAEHKNIGLLIVDSLIANFRNDYIGRGTLAERQGLLKKYVHELTNIAIIHNIPVVITNQVMDRPNVMFGDPSVMVGGNVVAHALNPNIFLRRGKDDTRIAKIKDASDLPESECVFRITENGLEEFEGKNVVGDE